MGELIPMPGLRASVPPAVEEIREPLMESWRDLLETLGQYIAGAPAGSWSRAFLRAGFKLLEAEFVDQADALGLACSVEELGDGRVRIRYWRPGPRP